MKNVCTVFDIQKYVPVYSLYNYYTSGMKKCCYVIISDQGMIIFLSYKKKNNFLDYSYIIKL